MHIRRLRPGEDALFRTLRLQALADAPDAFGQTLADAGSRPDSYWAGLTRSVTEPSRQVMFVAEAGDACVGLVFGLLDATRADVARLGGMWVAPVARHAGVGEALVAAVIAWARDAGFAHLELSVAEGNAAAIRLYEKTGFRDSGARGSLRPDSPVVTRRMARPTRDSGTGASLDTDVRP
jgi:ribosomal protein S18 acetylase RimI-like enzyme